MRKKKERFRGKTTHGHGSRKKARGAGNRGGRGMAGSGKRADQKKTKVLKENKEYFGKRGFVSKKKKIKAINLVDVGKYVKDKEINLKEIGYDKLLGKGNGLNVKIIVKKASEKAIEKMKKSGGEVILLKDAI